MASTTRILRTRTGWLPGCLTAWLTRGVDDDYRDAQIEAGAVAGAKAEGAAEARADADAAAAEAGAEARQSYPNRRMRIEQKAFACENALLLLLL